MYRPVPVYGCVTLLFLIGKIYRTIPIKIENDTYVIYKGH